MTGRTAAREARAADMAKGLFRRGFEGVEFFFQENL
jgi:hypothetical protein